MKNRRMNFPPSAELILGVGLCFVSSLCHGATIINLPTLGGTVMEPKALNRAGQIAGFARLANGDQHAFLYSAGVSYDLGTLGGPTSAGFGLNESGWVVGESGISNGAGTHPFLFTGASLTDLGTLGGTIGTAAAVNDLGDVVGSASFVGDLQYHAFLYRTNGALLDLGALGVGNSSATDINNQGQVTGWSTGANGLTVAFRWQNGIMTGFTLGGSAFAYAINEVGQVVGESFNTNKENHAFLYSGGTVIDLGTLGGTYSVAYAISQAGQVIGDSTTAGDADTHGFIYSGGVMTNLGTLGGTYSSAHAINHLGQVVGESDDVGGNTLAFLWHNGVMVNLNERLPVNSGWILQSAWFINDAGQVVGYGHYQGRFAWYLLNPGPANRPPVADAGPSQTVDCAVAAVLDGSRSSDPDGDPLTYEWREGSTVLAAEMKPSLKLPVGAHTITLTVTDPSGASSNDTVVVTVADATPPVIRCPAAQTVSPGADGQTRVPDFTADLVAEDNCTPALEMVKTQVPAAGTLVRAGSRPVAITVTDAAGNTTSCRTTFTVAETTAPVIRAAGVTPTELAPPNRRMVPVTVSVVAVDNGDLTPTCRIVDIDSSDPVTSQGDKTSPDWEITGPLTADLRAERSKGNVPRIYTLTVACIDASGHIAQTNLTVRVSAGGHPEAADSSKPNDPKTRN